MNFFLILPYYLSWHYGRALLDIKDVWSNFIFFVYNLFSVPALLATLFSPWMRIKDGYKVDSLLETFVFNSIMRVFGVFVRLCFIILGILALSVTVAIGLAFFIIWFFLPFIMVIIFFWSVGQLTI